MPTTPNNGGIDMNIGRAALVELLGTMILVFAGTSAAVTASLKLAIAGEPIDSLGVALAFGLALSFLAVAFGPASGGHFNPAVTIAMAVTNKIGWMQAVVYVLAQMIGAAIASGLVWLLFGEAARERALLGATVPASGVSDLQLFGMEVVVTFIFVLFVMALANDDRVPDAVGGIAAGFALTVAIIVSGPLTGGAVNPARALAPIFMSGAFIDYPQWWIYVVATVVGGAVAGVTYDNLLSRTQKPNSAK